MMKGEYARLLLSGKKRATVRLGKVIPKYDEVIIHSWGRPIAKARIVNVVHKKVRELTDEDAIKDGFKSREELINELKNVYGNVSPDDLVTIIELDIVQRFDKLIPEDPYLGLKPADIGRLALRYLRGKMEEDDLKILEELAKGKSIRKLAKELTGSPLNRGKIRKVLRKALRLLVREGILRVESREAGK
ncbi:MAG TPA: ASCH domain-containing protein [Acidilobales archaeon]|nr:ASCH domain-containing protein [Acidilobales archaeon]